MAGILVYALHDDEGNFNKNSLGAISEAAKLAGELGTEAAAVVVGDLADHHGRGVLSELTGELRRLGEGAEGVLVEVALVVVEGVDQDASH